MYVSRYYKAILYKRDSLSHIAGWSLRSKAKGMSILLWNLDWWFVSLWVELWFD